MISVTSDNFWMNLYSKRGNVTSFRLTDVRIIICYPLLKKHTFYNGLTLRHRDTINAAVGGTFMKRRPEECYDLIENMTSHHNDWDTSAHRGESSSSTTSSSSDIAALTQQMTEMRKDILQMYRSNQQVNYMTPSCETCGGPHSYYECQAADGYTQDVYATTGNYNSGGNAYQPQGNLPPPTPSSEEEEEVKQNLEPTMDHVHIFILENTTQVPSLIVQPSLGSKSSKLPPSPDSKSSELPPSPASRSSELPK
ncbi:hypothetical protein Tco_0548462 [Tanacetum coccineum]